MKLIKGLLLLVFVVIFFASVRGATQGGKGKSQVLERGKTVYLANCAKCHGADGLGKTTMGEMVEPPDLSNTSWQSQRSDSRMISSVVRGRGQMPALGKKLSRSQIASAVAYVRTLKK